MYLETSVMRTFLKNSNASQVKVIVKLVSYKPFYEYGRRELKAVQIVQKIVPDSGMEITIRFMGQYEVLNKQLDISFDCQNVCYGWPGYILHRISTLCFNITASYSRNLAEIIHFVV
jgi:hypothetical protein